MASSTALQLDKSSWSLQILIVYRLGKVSPTPEAQALPAPNHTPYGSRYMVEHTYQHIVASSSGDLALGPSLGTVLGVLGTVTAL